MFIYPPSILILPLQVLVPLVTALLTTGTLRTLPRTFSCSVRRIVIIAWLEV